MGVDGKNVDFSDRRVKELALLHVSKQSEGDYTKRPFLSTSTDLPSLLTFGTSKVEFERRPGYEPRCEYAAIVLICLYKDNKFTENSFVDLSTEKSFVSFFRERSVSDDY